MLHSRDLRRALRKMRKQGIRAARAGKQLREAFAVLASDHPLSPDEAERLREAWNKPAWFKAHPEYAVHPVVYNAVKAFGKQSAPDSRTATSREDEENHRAQ